RLSSPKATFPSCSRAPGRPAILYRELRSIPRARLLQVSATRPMMPHQRQKRTNGTRSLQMPKQSSLPANVSEFRDRHGKWRLRYRAKGQKTHYFKSSLGSDEFAAELAECRAGAQKPNLTRGANRIRPGSVAAL